MFFNLFKRRQKKTEEKIKFSELTSWLNESELIQSIKSRFQDETKHNFFQLSNNFDKILQAVQILKTAGVENKKANEKLKSLVLQNKDVYAGQVEHLVSILRVEAGAVRMDNVEDVENFTAKASEQLNNFSKQSFKSFHLTSELIGRELEAIVTGIAALNNYIEKIKAIDKEKIKNIELIRRTLSDTEEKEALINQLKTEITKKEEEKQDNKKRLTDIQEENTKIQSNSEWKRKEELKIIVSDLNKKLESNTLSAKSLFLAVEKAIKKWAWKEENNKILLCLEKPIEAIKQDADEILDILNKIKEDILQNQLDLDERRKDQFLKTISSITKEKLLTFIDEEDKIKNEIEKSRQELDNSNIQLIDASKLIRHENELILEISKLGKRQNSFEKEILYNQNEIESAVSSVADVKLII